MKQTTATALVLSLGLAFTGWTDPALAAKHDDAAAHALQMQQHQAAAAQSRAAAEGQRQAAANWQREQARQWEAAHRHGFAEHSRGSGGGLNAWQACSMFFGRC